MPKKKKKIITSRFKYSYRLQTCHFLTELDILYSMLQRHGNITMLMVIFSYQNIYARIIKRRSGWRPGDEWLQTTMCSSSQSSVLCVYCICDITPIRLFFFFQFTCTWLSFWGVCLHHSFVCSIQQFVPVSHRRLQFSRVAKSGNQSISQLCLKVYEAE